MDENKLAAEYADTFGNMGSDAWNNAYTCYLAGFNAHKQNLQQTPCTTLREELEQMLKEENEALGKAGFYEQYNRETHANRKYCLAIVLQMIEARQPVA